MPKTHIGTPLIAIGKYSDTLVITMFCHALALARGGWKCTFAAENFSDKLNDSLPMFYAAKVFYYMVVCFTPTNSHHDITAWFTVQ